jgi:hypothetical protein
MFYESLAFNEGGNDGFWRFQLRGKYGRWIKMGGAAMFEFRKPNDKNVYKAKGTFQGNIRRGASIIRVGEGEQLPPGDYEVDSRYIESIKAIINTTSAKPEIVDAPKSVNPDVEKQATEREMVAATVKDLEAGDIVQQSTEEALYGQINSVEHGDTESKINVTWSDGSNYDMNLPSDQKIKVWGVEPESETVDAAKVDSIWGDAAPNERDVVAAVYARLSADMPVAEIAALDPDFATYPDSMKSDPASIKEVAIGAIQELVRRWNGSSIYDDSTKVLHEVAREHFGISGASPVELTEGGKALMENKEAYKAVLDAIYASTQEMFANAGIEEITVYRGSKTDSSGVRPLSSWTTSEATAKAFAGSDGDTREMTVPVSQILSTAMSGGLGAWNEKEVVLLGPSETVDAGNVEEAKPEVSEATRVIDSYVAAAEVTAALAEKVGVLSTSTEAPRKFKKHAAKVILDKMLEAGVTAEQLVGAADSDGAFVTKYDKTAPESALDFETVINKLPETIDIVGGIKVAPEVILSPDFDDDTVVGAGSKINLLKVNDRYGVTVFSVDAPEDFVNMEGKTLKEIQTLAQEHPAMRGFYGEFTVVGTSDSKRMYTESLISNMIHNWALNSNDRNIDSLAIQESAKTLFGLTDVAPWDMDDDDKKAVETKVSLHGDTYQMFLRAQYDATQGFFAEQGVKTLKLFRGFTSKFKVETGYTDTTLRPLSSFSTKESQAAEFALPDNYDYGYLVEMMVPVEDILAIPGLGFGCYEENEVVVLGGKKSAWVSSE